MGNLWLQWTFISQVGTQQLFKGNLKKYWAWCAKSQTFCLFVSLVALPKKLQFYTASSMVQLEWLLTAKPFMWKAWYPHYAHQDLYFGLTLAGDLNAHLQLDLLNTYQESMFWFNFIWKESYSSTIWCDLKHCKWGQSGYSLKKCVPDPDKNTI